MNIRHNFAAMMALAASFEPLRAVTGPELSPHDSYHHGRMRLGSKKGQQCPHGSKPPQTKWDREGFAETEPIMKSLLYEAACAGVFVLIVIFLAMY